MLVRTFLLIAAAACAGFAQTVCGPTPAYSVCEIAFELSPQEAAAHPNPYATLTLEAEIRSPRFHTFRVPAFWDGGNRVIVRFAPTDPGQWVFRVTSNIKRFDGYSGEFTAKDSDSHGFLRPANVHHWALADDNVLTPHLWMGDTMLTFASIDRGAFEKIVTTRAAQSFNHIRGVVLALPEDITHSYASPDQPQIAWFRELDERVRFLNAKGIIADLVLAWTPDQITKAFPTWEQRTRFVRYLAARYAAMNVTWQLALEFESAADSRELCKALGQALKKYDVYGHPRTTGAQQTSSPLLGDEWMNYVAYGTPDEHLGSIEHQIDAVPFVNLVSGAENSGAGGSAPDTTAFRRRLWNATMSGQYPTFANTGTSGEMAVDAKYAESDGTKQMKVWFDFFARTRHWELEPYFEVDGGRALALERPHDEEIEGVEYIVYVEKPGTVEIMLQKHGYEIEWINPITGEAIPQKKFKADRFSGAPPDQTHDWVLHIFREGRLDSLRSYKFESRAIIMQEVEQAPPRVPFEITEPAADPVSVSKPPHYAVKVTRETRATRSMMWLWTGEVASGGRGVRILGTGPSGTFRVPSNLTTTYPATLAVRLYGLNAHGKVYSIIRIYQLAQ